MTPAAGTAQRAVSSAESACMVTVASAAAAHPGRMTNHSAPDLAAPAGTALPARGVVRADVTRDEIDPAAPAAQVARASAGADVTFSGFVRDHDDGRAVVRIEYVAHPSAGEGPCAGRRRRRGTHRGRRARSLAASRWAWHRGVRGRGGRLGRAAGGRGQTPSAGVEGSGLRRWQRRIGRLPSAQVWRRMPMVSPGLPSNGCTSRREPAGAARHEER